MQDRPTAIELLEAVREFVERDVMGEPNARTPFLARVAVNVLGIVERELRLGPEADARERARLQELLGAGEDDLRALNAELASRIRAGSTTGPELITHLRATVTDKLAIANPRYMG